MVFARSTHVGARQRARPPTTPGATVSGSRGWIIIVIIIIIIIIIIISFFKIDFYITLYNYKKSINVKQINDVTTWHWELELKLQYLRLYSDKLPNSKRNWLRNGMVIIMKRSISAYLWIFLVSNYRNFYCWITLSK